MILFSHDITNIITTNMINIAISRENATLHIILEKPGVKREITVQCAEITG